MEERRGYVRFPVISNVGEPIELNVTISGKALSIPGYIINLSGGGVGIITLGKEAESIPLGTSFALGLNITGTETHQVQGKVVRVEKGKKAQLRNSNDQWFLSLNFTKVKPAFTQLINHMAEDWSICETKMQMNLPDICFRECTYWNLCEKPPKLKEPELKNAK